MTELISLVHRTVAPSQTTPSGRFWEHLHQLLPLCFRIGSRLQRAISVYYAIERLTLMFPKEQRKFVELTLHKWENCVEEDVNYSSNESVWLKQVRRSHQYLFDDLSYSESLLDMGIHSQIPFSQLPTSPRDHRLYLATACLEYQATHTIYDNYMGGFRSGLPHCSEYGVTSAPSVIRRFVDDHHQQESAGKEQLVNQLVTSYHHDMCRLFVIHQTNSECQRRKLLLAKIWTEEAWLARLSLETDLVIAFARTPFVPPDIWNRPKGLELLLYLFAPDSIPIGGNTRKGSDFHRSLLGM